MELTDVFQQAENDFTGDYSGQYTGGDGEVNTRHEGQYYPQRDYEDQDR